VRVANGGIVITAPTLASLDVSSGTEAGGTSVVATGTGLFGTTGVTVNGVAATGVTYNANGTVTFVTPAATFALSSTAASNAKNVVLTNPAGSSTLTGGYTYSSEFKRIAGSLYYSEFRFNDPAASIISTAVASLPDYNGNAALAQGTAGARPAYEATGWNGGPSGLADGSDDYLIASLSPAIASGTRPYIFVAFQRVSGTSNNTVAGILDNTGNNQIRIYVNNASDYLGVRTDNSTSGNSGLSGKVDTNRHLFEMGYTASGTSSFVFDGTGYDNARTAAPAANQTALTLFSFSTGAFVVNGRASWMLLLSNEPDATTKTNIRNAAKSPMWIGYTSSSLGLP
jgi:hypothetical protein